MHLLNGDLLNRKIAARDGRIDDLFKAKRPLPEVVQELYLAALSRRPTGDEVTKMKDFASKQQDQKAAYGDMLWVLLNSSEFALNR